MIPQLYPNRRPPAMGPLPVRLMAEWPMSPPSPLLRPSLRLRRRFLRIKFDIARPVRVDRVRETHAAPDLVVPAHRPDLALDHPVHRAQHVAAGIQFGPHPEDIVGLIRVNRIGPETAFCTPSHAPHLLRLVARGRSLIGKLEHRAEARR